MTVTNFLKPDQALSGAFPLTTLAGTSQLTLESGVTIDARGLWVNTQLDPNDVAGLAFLNGGNVTFDSTQNVTLKSGSTIDVSSGGAILAKGKTQGGKGGNVTLTAGHAFGNLSAPSLLTLDGAIRAFGVNGGGTLTVNAPGNILIGENATLSGGVLSAGTPAPLALTLAQEMTIAAGEPLPFGLTENFTTLPPGQIAPVDVFLGDTTGLVTAAPWTVPVGFGLVFVGNSDHFQTFSEGQTIPAGSPIFSFLPSSHVAAGTAVDPNVFPNGIPVQPYQVVLTAGSIQATATTYPVGTPIPAGSVLPQTVSIQPAPALNNAFFNTGFANYVIDGAASVLVADGTVINPAMPVYQFTAASFAAPTGSDPAAALSLWLPPLFTENPLNGTLTQRSGASLTLRSVTSTAKALVTGGGITIGEGVSIAVDPGQGISLDSFGQLTVNGSLTAHGGSINLTNENPFNFDVTSGAPLGISTWIGGDARLDVSAEAYTAFDLSGRPYGSVTNGGSINVKGSSSYVLIQPGAELDADGAAVTIDLAAGLGRRTPSQLVTVASNGGSIAFSSNSGIYDNGAVHAASGGAGAAGGSLSITQDTPVYADPSNANAGPVPGAALTPAILTLAQEQPAAGGPLVIGTTTVSATAVEAGGFDNVSLISRDYLVFSGDVSLTVGQSLTLSANAFASGAPVSTVPTQPVTGTVKLVAPYVLLTSPTPGFAGFATGSIGTSSFLASNPTVATFEVDAQQIDVQGSIWFGPNAKGVSPAFKTISLISQGDIRFLAPPAGQGTMTVLVTPWDLNLVAAQIYPATNTEAGVAAGDNPQKTGTLTIGRINDIDPAMPSSVFGQLILDAPTIEQGGILRAPLGGVKLGGNDNGVHALPGVPTQTIDLLSGSITSASADGLIIPYGGTTDGVTYSYNGTAVSPAAVATQFGDAGRGVTLDSGFIAVHDGAIVDVSGGGTVTGAGFISGRGGSVNVLTTPLINANPGTPVSRATDKVYAIVPGYASSYAPIAAEKGGGDPVVGQQITIPAGVPGLPAGTYTLLPSTYALLPGAFRVEIGNTTTQALGTGPIGNGTYVTTGTTGIANSSIKSALPSVLLITPGSRVRTYSQYNEQSYSDFMQATAALVGSPRPQLPIDATTLNIVLEAASKPAEGSSLTFDGTALMQGAAGGYGGTVSITAVQFGSQGPALEIYNDQPTPNFAGVSVAAKDLDKIAAPRMVIGGTLGQGQAIQNGATIATGILSIGGGASGLFIRPGVDLTAGEIFLAASGTIDVGAGATLSTIGQGAAPYELDQRLCLQGLIDPVGLVERRARLRRLQHGLRGHSD